MNHTFDKVVWQEGMFLSPQHFQQQERYLEHHSRQLLSIQNPGQAGFISLRIDTEQLKAGKLFLREACGLFPDGTPFELTDNLIRDIDSANAGATVYLALPLLRSAQVDTATAEHLSSAIRHKSFDRTIRDSTNHDNDTVELELCLLNPSLMLDGEPLDDYTTLAVARIQEFNSDSEILLDSTFIPRCMDYRVSRYLVEQVQNMQALMQQRAALIAAQIGVEGELKSFQTMQIAYMWLQALNRYGAWLKQIEHQTGVSAAQLYHDLVMMAADLSTFTTTLAPDFPVFDENNIYASFAPVISCLLLNLRQASKEKVVTVSWDKSLYKRRRLLRCEFEDRTLFNDGRFILAVSSGLGSEVTRSTFVSAAKLCGHNRIAERVRNALSAVPLTPMATAPLELRIQPNTVYFEIDTGDALWQEMIRTRDKLALHVDEQMPEDTTIECFVIR
ncbi:type VI secretion system baseplate subunit TssK [Endozoicomonas euniceicola]|uniref:Type VI secretion system baseplate subunit TssK n=1 Tax=Endozoicomonas euniceicola TaxID=1234143 RepID=A0ABY6GQ54_9GAMM|nr:type VI secretion system baseplate subunit TssK [Endozoicomonas euniceicola]UYM14862.1 type VI secretion system baseplate subunit TssK [Endozoicomonas euniceicola]